jgi:hypothetical protein
MHIVQHGNCKLSGDADRWKKFSGNICLQTNVLFAFNLPSEE